MLSGPLFLELQFSMGYGLVDLVVCPVFPSELMIHSHPCRRASKSEQLFIRSRTAVNPLTSNDPYRGRTAPLTSKVTFYIFIKEIYLLSILNMVFTLRFFLFKMPFVS